MDDVINLINHLINAKYSIDKIESITNRLNLSKEQILKILRADRYKDYFQLLFFDKEPLMIEAPPIEKEKIMKYEFIVFFLLLDLVVMMDQFYLLN